MGILEVSKDDQFVRVTGDTPLLDVARALPAGLFPPFPAVELPGGVAGLLERGGFAQTFFVSSELLGVTFRTPAGRRVHAGGKVVKNVQGYDLVRALVGSFGTLGTIEEATLRLRPGIEHAHLARPGDLPGAWVVRPRFAWTHAGTLHVVHFGAAREIERLRREFGGGDVTEPVDYRSLFPNGMGVGDAGELRDGRFRWSDGGARPAVPPLFARLVRALEEPERGATRAR